jgi:hypothetical protein
VYTDGFIDLLMQLFAGLYVVRREPGPNPLNLEVGIQPLGECLISGRVGDEAGVELDGLHRCDESFHLHDERLWHASSAQEDLRNLSFGSVDGIDTDGRRSIMSNGFKPLNCAQIKVRKDCPPYN